MELDSKWIYSCLSFSSVFSFFLSFFLKSRFRKIYMIYGSLSGKDVIPVLACGGVIPLGRVQSVAYLTRRRRGHQCFDQSSSELSFQSPFTRERHLFSAKTGFSPLVNHGRNNCEESYWPPEKQRIQGLFDEVCIGGGKLACMLMQ